MQVTVLKSPVERWWGTYRSKAVSKWLLRQWDPGIDLEPVLSNSVLPEIIMQFILDLHLLIFVSWLYYVRSPLSDSSSHTHDHPYGQCGVAFVCWEVFFKMFPYLYLLSNINWRGTVLLLFSPLRRMLFRRQTLNFDFVCCEFSVQHQIQSLMTILDYLLKLPEDKEGRCKSDVNYCLIWKFLREAETMHCILRTQGVSLEGFLKEVSHLYSCHLLSDLL